MFRIILPIVFLCIIIFIGILFIDALEEDKEVKKRKVKTFLIVLAIILVLGSLGVFRTCENDGYYDDDPSEWARHSD